MRNSVTISTAGPVAAVIARLDCRGQPASLSDKLAWHSQWRALLFVRPEDPGKLHRKATLSFPREARSWYLSRMEMLQINVEGWPENYVKLVESYVEQVRRVVERCGQDQEQLPDLPVWTGISLPPQEIRKAAYGAD